MEMNTAEETSARIIPFSAKEITYPENGQATNNAIKIPGLKRVWIEYRVIFAIFIIALKCYRSLPKAIKAAKGLQAFKNNIHGSNKTGKYVKVDGKYYSSIYIPAFPSRFFDRFIITELNRILPHSRRVNTLEVLQLAITNKCPMQCEHCFEWNNLNLPEPFTTDEIKNIIDKFQEAGCTQFHFTGGEPVVRMNKLEALIRHAAKESECWILSSGTNLTLENAQRLKNAGATGVIISLDHFDKKIHNTFRGSEHAFENALNAVKNANKVKLVTAFSICLTRSFITVHNLMRFAKLSKDCAVSFVQLLEPKAVGHYEGKDVMLSKEQFAYLDAFYLNINFNKRYNEYPIFIYHGYYQRKTGCMSAGKLVMYIDSAGFINACPFCQTKNHHARDIINGKLKTDQITTGSCPAYK